MGYPVWNKKADANVVCWLCEHFQRRDNTGGTQNCQGECRKKPIGPGGLLRNNTEDSNGDLDGAFAYVPYGNTTWCSGFQASLEENIPDVVEGKANCADQSIDDWQSPRDNMTAAAPRLNKKTMENSCWYCEHFQRTPEDSPSGTPCVGFCFIDPIPSFQRENANWGTGGNDVMDYYWSETQMQNSAYFWCSRWERSRQEVPDPPEQGGLPCGSGI